MSSEIFVGAYCRDMELPGYGTAGIWNCRDMELPGYGTAQTISIDNRSPQFSQTVWHAHTSPSDNQYLFSLSEKIKQENYTLSSFTLQAHQDYKQQRGCVTKK